jgi:hypothetical protein
MSKYQDFFGNNINPGDYITYAALDGRCAVLRVAQVIALSNRRPSQWNTKEDLAETLKVRSVELYFGKDIRPIERVVTLGFLKRLVVIPADSVPQHWKDAIAQAGAKH